MSEPANGPMGVPGAGRPAETDRLLNGVEDDLDTLDQLGTADQVAGLRPHALHPRRGAGPDRGHRSATRTRGAGCVGAGWTPNWCAGGWPAPASRPPS